MSALPLVFGVIVVVGVVVGLALRSRVMASCLLLPMAAFCAFGFLASFEVPGPAWKIGYAVVGLACLAGAILPWLRKRNHEPTG